MALRTISTVALQKELERRQKASTKLKKRREQLARELEAVDKELAGLGITPPSRPAKRGGRRASTSSTGRRRAKNEISLPDAIAQAMEIGAVVSPQEAAELVKKNGYKTTSANFNMMVSNALSKDKRFKRLSRGQYERVK